LQTPSSCCAVQLRHKLCQQRRPLAAHVAGGVHHYTPCACHFLATTTLLLLLLLLLLCCG
jgi:hypothetical protein